MKVFVPTTAVALTSLSIQVDLFVKKAGSKLAIQVPDISEAFKNQFQGQVFSVRQQVAMDFEGSKLDLLIEAFEHAAILDDKQTSGGCCYYYYYAVVIFVSIITVMIE